MNADPKPEGFEPVRIPVAGVMHQDPSRVLHELKLSEPIWIRREHHNDFDMNAISVETDEHQRLGYVGRTVAVRLAPYMDTRKAPLQAVVTELTRDVSGEVVGMAVSVYLPAQLSREIRGEARSWTSYCDIGDDGVAYLFLECDEAELNQVNEALRRNALPWRRSGLSYRAAPDGRQYRWYVRLEGEVSEDALRQIIENTLGPSFDDSARIARLEQEKHVLNSRMSDLEREAKRSGPQRRNSPRRDLVNVIRILLPDVHFLRDSLDVITQELESFEPVLRKLRNLCSDHVNVKGERVEGTGKWKERHFSTGQKNDGRFYFTNDGSTWRVLVSFKDSQKRDIDYLKRC
jgi:hypothetical protein